MKKSVIILISLVCITLCGPSYGANKYWDTNGATPGAGGATPAGTWNNTGSL